MSRIVKTPETIIIAIVGSLMGILAAVSGMTITAAAMMLLLVIILIIVVYNTAKNKKNSCVRR